VVKEDDAVLEAAGGLVVIVFGLYGALGRGAPSWARRWASKSARLLTLGKWSGRMPEDDDTYVSNVRLVGWIMVGMGVLFVVAAILRAAY
jgi:hypothetical protein